MSGTRKPKPQAPQNAVPQLHIVRLAPLERIGAITLLVTLIGLALTFGVPKAIALVHFLMEI